MSKKGIILAIILVIFIIGVLATFFIIKIQNGNTDYQIEKIEKYSYFKLYENEKYGIIDENGNTIIEAKYDNIDIPNPTKPVFIVSFNYNAEKEEYETQVINEKNEKILTQFEKVNAIQLNDTNAQIPYEKSVLMYKEKDKYGIIDFNGKKITDAIYDSIESLLYKEGCLIVKQNGKYGIINILGKKMVEIEYDSINADGYYEKETGYKKAGFIVGLRKEDGYRYGYISSKKENILNTEYNQINRITEIDNNDIYLYAIKNGQVGVFQNGKQIVKNIYEQVEYDKENGVFIVKKDNKYGVVNKENKEIIPLEYSYIMISNDRINAKKEEINYIYDIDGKKLNVENITIISTDNKDYYIIIDSQGKFGIMDKNNTTILDTKYQYIEHIFDNYFIAKLDGKAGVIDNKGIEKISFKYDVIQKIKNTKIIQAIISNENMSYIYNSKLEQQLSYKNALISDEGDYIKVLSKTNREYLDKEGNKLKNNDIFKDLNLYAYNENNKWGFKDNNEKVIIDAKYDMVTEFNQYGYAGIYSNEKWGVIDQKGNVVLEPTYTINFSEPDFIGKYIKLNFGYGFYYYTDKVE